MNSPSLPSTLLNLARAAGCVCLAALPLLAAGQTNSPALIYPKNRYLLVVETSRAMQRRADVMALAVRELLNSAVAGQARRGDTLGVWTFDEDLHTGLLPLQQWSPDSQAAITDRIVGFLKAQKFEKHARFDKVVPAVEGLARNSQFITVLLVCSGEADIHGTRFDQRINEFFRTWRLQPQDAGTPFIIALRAQSGTFVECAMNPSPWPAELPALPKELLTPVPSAQPMIAPSQKPVTSSVPPLIISGKKRAPAPAPADPGAPKPQVTATLSPTNPLPSTQTLPPAQPAPILPANTAPAEPASASPAVTASTTPNTRGPLPDSSPGQRGSSQVQAPSVADSRPTTSAPPGLVTLSPAAQQPSEASEHKDTPALVTPAVSNREPVQVATSVPVNKSLYRATLIFMGLVSLLAIGTAIWFWRLRTRRTHETSLITESFDRREP
ncbi:MAG TPA: hypothetical protein VFE51_12395 [Verrucomicrobiae bacterium]|nr:hypothetical protein [Verrucomicrobiae bacterium]